MFTPLQPVHVRFDGKHAKKYDGMVICDVGEMQGNTPHKTYAVRFFRDGSVYEKCLSIGNISARGSGGEHDDKLSDKAHRTWLSQFTYNPSFKKRYMFGIKYKQKNARLAARYLEEAHEQEAQEADQARDASGS